MTRNTKNDKDELDPQRVGTYNNKKKKIGFVPDGDITLTNYPPQ